MYLDKKNKSELIKLHWIDTFYRVFSYKIFCHDIEHAFQNFSTKIMANLSLIQAK